MNRGKYLKLLRCEEASRWKASTGSGVGSAEHLDGRTSGLESWHWSVWWMDVNADQFCRYSHFALKNILSKTADQDNHSTAQTLTCALYQSILSKGWKKLKSSLSIFFTILLASYLAILCSCKMEGIFCMAFFPQFSWWFWGSGCAVGFFFSTPLLFLLSTLTDQSQKCCT